MASYQNKNEYLLMNKDRPVLSFLCSRNVFDEPEFQELFWHVPYRPIGYKTLTGFLERRKAPKHREHIQRLLERFGCDDLEGFLNVTHAVSLNDTFWVKKADGDLCWDQVSLYRNEFDQLISEAAFDGSASSSELSTTSPEFGTDGNYAKCWVREDDDIYLYKTGSSRYEVEPLSEFLAAQLAAILCPSFVDYDLDFYRGKLISKCRLFTNESQGLAKAAGIFQGQRTIPVLLDYLRSLEVGMISAGCVFWIRSSSIRTGTTEISAFCLIPRLWHLFPCALSLTITAACFRIWTRINWSIRIGIWSAASPCSVRIFSLRPAA